MRLWRITPAAAPDDPRWQHDRIWREVVVRAENAAEARVIAARMEADETDRQDFNPDYNAANTSAMEYPSALYDEALYDVLELPETPQFSPDGPREVLLAHRTGTA